MIPIEPDKISSLRKSYSNTINQIDKLTGCNKYQEAEDLYSDAEGLIEKIQPLLDMSITTHKNIWRNITIDLGRAESDISNGLNRREAGKKQDGNIAFKCNWNDANYKGLCSQDAYLYNQKWGGPWCRASRCIGFIGKTPPAQLPEDICYESIALVNYSFGAGWDHKNGIAIRPRRIDSPRVNKIALLTTVPPNIEGRILVGAFRIQRIQEDLGKETFIFGDKDTCLDDMLHYKIHFWNFHINPNKPHSQQWGCGLFRYISDVAVLGILEEYRDKKIKESGDVSKVDQLIVSLKD